jgi:hypothetical protein
MLVECSYMGTHLFLGRAAVGQVAITDLDTKLATEHLAVTAIDDLALPQNDGVEQAEFAQALPHLLGFGRGEVGVIATDGMEGIGGISRRGCLPLLRLALRCCHDQPARRNTPAPFVAGGSMLP